ncbi:uncharacterized protein LOC126830395 [Patella vulgata]|uniref:uncharacterized protein LOC126830395 n=1 Tax=Patella vulgata TaxID=6465 RepID=UPI0024A84E2B|nr:uncharacterized protein LOC126830395 [Patella vulgata]
MSCSIYGGCPGGWITYNNTCYYLSATRQKFNDAISFCDTKNATLPIYNSDDDWKEGKPAKGNVYNLCAGMNVGNHGYVYLQNCMTTNQVLCQRPADVIDQCDGSNGWKDISGQCFKFFEEKRTWRDARVTCQQYNGDLVLPKVALDILLLADVVPCKGPDNNPWVGISDTIVYYCYYNPFELFVKGTCPVGWTTNGETCYQYHGNRAEYESWFGAKSTCENKGSELLMIQDKDENAVIAKFFKQHKIRNTWLGFTDYNEDHTSKWIDGISLSDDSVYKHFQRGYPRVYGSLFTCGILNIALSCPKDWTLFRQDCYYIGTGKNRTDASNYCTAMSATLTTIRDPYEQAFIVKYKKWTDTVWIGMTYVQGQGKFLWDGFQSPQFYNFYPGKTNTSMTCVELVGASRGVTYPGTWESQLCSKKNSFICRQAAGGSTQTIPTAQPTAAWSRRCGGPGWIDNNLDNACYQINVQKLKWADARHDCQKKGGELLSISGTTEQIHIQATLGSSQFAYLEDNLWIGGSDRNDEGGWEWSDGSPFRYLNWHPGEPNMVGKGHNCMVLTLGNWNFQWDNRPCTMLQPYICKRKRLCKPMPMLSGNYSLPDTGFASTASSDINHGPQFSRITPTNKAYWRPLRSDTRQYLTASFYNVMVIKGITIMGSPDNTQWVTKYKLQYQLNYFAPWYDYEDPPGQTKIFDGNSDGITTFSNFLSYPIEAKSIKIIPVTWNIGIALRWEIYGCIEEECRAEYGVSGPLIVQDAGFAASSILDPQHSPHDSRLVPINANEPAACWKPQVTDKDIWIERSKLIRGVTIMGNPDAAEWVTSYKVSYQINDGTKKFHIYQEPYGTDKIFQGNTNTSIRVTNMFLSHFQANKVRILPLTYNGAIALRLDILICPKDFISGCQDVPLINGNSKIPDEQITASSQYDNDHGPMRSRLNTNTQGALASGWLAQYNDKKQYIQVDLGEPIQVTAIATQGRPDRNEWVREFKLSISNDGINFNFYYIGNNVTLFDANWDALSVRKQYLPAPIVARYIQLWPTDWQKRIALRWEIYGCPGPASNTKIGCYADVAEDRDLPFEALSDPETGLWPPMCIQHCYLKGYHYAGVQNGDKCFCGNSYGKYGVGFNCSVPCFPRKRFMCGGEIDNFIYSTGLSSLTRVCKAGWKSYNDKCYLVIEDIETWADARAACLSVGAELVSISDSHEQDFVASLTADVRADMWIGFNDLQHELMFEWSNDEEVLYTNWNLGQPSNPAGTEEDCVTFTYKTGGWQDEVCDTKKKYICEMEKKPSDVIPTKPTIPGCGKDWDSYRWSCYLYVPQPRSWSDAAKVCQSYSGTLVQINDWNEASYINSQLGSKKGFYWMDVNDNDKGGVYRFSDGGAKIPLSHWAPHKPDQKGHCVALGSGKTAGLWYNMNCSTLAPAVCEKQRVGFTTPMPITKMPSLIPCPTGWLGEGEWCYQVNNVSWHLQRTWADAQDDCIAKGAKLASFHNISHLQDLYTSTLQSGGDHFWIGLNDLSGKGYTWSDGTAVDFTSWADNEPNDFQGTAENCVEIKVENGKFNDQDCSKIRNWICGIKKGQPLQPVTTILPPTPGPASDCAALSVDNQTKWSSYNGNCYLIVDGSGISAQTWGKARDSCRSNYHAELASVTSDEENRFIFSQITNVTSYSLWIGLNELDTGKGYKWSDGSPPKYFNWNLNEPNDYLGLEACTDIFVRNGKWNDDHCDIRQGYVCKKNLKAKTLPTILPVMPGNCPVGFSAYGNKCFQVFGGKRKYSNWTAARAACEQLGDGDLASISNYKEQAFLTTLFLNVWWSVWIGLYQRNGQFAWYDNEEAAYFNWAQHEPSPKKGDTNPQCGSVLVDHSRVGQWREMTCTSLMGYVCQVPKQATLPTQPPIQTDCDSKNGFRPVGRNCVKLVSNAMTWMDARTYCQGLGTDLTSINTPYEQAGLIVLANENGNTKPIWTGFNDQAHKGQYYWSDGWPVVDSFWGPNQPNSSVSTGCVSFHVNGSWFDESCSQKYSFFCKKTLGTPPVTPAPGTGQCPGASWQAIGSDCYRFNVKQFMTFGDAISYCNDQDGQLLSIHDNVTNDFIYNTVKENTGWAIWVGLHKSQDSGYKWLDKSPVDFFKWDKSEPKLKDTGGEPLQCVQMLSYKQGKWNAISCNKGAMGVVCKRPMSYNTNTKPLPNIGPIVTSRPLTPSPPSSNPQTSIPQTPKPQTPKPLTPKPQTPSNPVTPKPQTANPITYNPKTANPRITSGPFITKAAGRTSGSPNNTPAPLKQGSPGTVLGGGAIAGIAVAAIVIVVLVILVVVLFLRKNAGRPLGFSRSFSNALYESSSAAGGETNVLR